MALLPQQLNIALDIIAFGFSDQANDFLSVQLAGIRDALPARILHHGIAGRPKIP